MQIYLPIAETSVNIFTMFGMGTAVGFLSGLFGVGGGFLITPLLMLSGIPAAVAIATGANQVVASSVSGTLTQWRRGNVDMKMGTVLLAGGVIGALIGVQAVKALARGGSHRDRHFAALFRFSQQHRHFDAEREHAGDASSQKRQAALRAKTWAASLGPWSAAQAALSAVEALYQRNPAIPHRHGGRAALRHIGRGRRFHHGARHDLSAAHAHQGRDRHEPVPDHFRRRHHDDPACGDQPGGRSAAGI